MHTPCRMHEPCTHHACVLHAYRARFSQANSVPYSGEKACTRHRTCKEAKSTGTVHAIRAHLYCAVKAPEPSIE